MESIIKIGIDERKIRNRTNYLEIDQIIKLGIERITNSDIISRKIIKCLF